MSLLLYIVMSYDKQDHINDINDDVRSTCSDEPRLEHYALQQYCVACLEERGNAIGCISSHAKAWFCSGGCMTYYFHKNKLANYSQPVVSEILKMESKHFKPEILNKRRKRLGLPTHFE